MREISFPKSSGQLYPHFECLWEQLDESLGKSVTFLFLLKIFLIFILLNVLIFLDKKNILIFPFLDFKGGKITSTSDIFKSKLNFRKNRSILNFYLILMNLEKVLPQRKHFENASNHILKITI